MLRTNSKFVLFLDEEIYSDVQDEVEIIFGVKKNDGNDCKCTAVGTKRTITA